MTDSLQSKKMKISSIIITDRTRKDLGNIASLAESISSFGLMLPVVINENNELIDGQRRIKACIQLGIKEVPIFRIDLKEIILGEFHANSNRKDFTPSERVAISQAVEKILEGQSRRVGRPRSDDSTSSKVSMSTLTSAVTINDEHILNSKSIKNNAVNLTTFSSSPSSSNYKLTGRIKDNVAKYLGVSRNTLDKEKKLIEAAKQAPEQFEELRKKIDLGKISTHKAYNELQKQVKRNQILASAKNLASSNLNLQKGTSLLHGDFREQILEVPDGYVDLVFTDPPYSKDCLPVYHDLAIASGRVLKNGASLVTYVNHCLVPEITKIMEDLGLNRQWIIAVKLSGPFAHFHPKKVSIKWKPLLWFVKGDKTNSLDYISDFIESKSAEKATFEWEQNTIEVEHVISRLTVEGQTVCDPMMGEGTSGVAATKLGRRFIGIENNSERFDVARARISKTSLSQGIPDSSNIMTSTEGGS
jgi:ParB/RepB/Spo0J family partition protein